MRSFDRKAGKTVYQFPKLTVPVYLCRNLISENTFNSIQYASLAFIHNKKYICGLFTALRKVNNVFRCFLNKKRKSSLHEIIDANLTVVRNSGHILSGSRLTFSWTSCMMFVENKTVQQERADVGRQANSSQSLKPGYHPHTPTIIILKSPSQLRKDPC